MRPLNLYSIRPDGDMLIEANFQSSADTAKAISEGLAIDDIVYKASPSVAGVEKPLVRVQLNLLRMTTDDELKEGLLSSLRYYGKVYQIRQIRCNGYFEGQLTITIDPSHGYVDDDGKHQESQPLQRMLYLEQWDIFASASFKGAQPICYYCRQAGHIRSACPELAKRRCFGCGETGHTKRFCKRKSSPPAVAIASESELLDNYVKDSAIFATDTEKQEDETVEGDSSMDEDKAAPYEEEVTIEDGDEDMDIVNAEMNVISDKNQDPAESVLASKWAPYDKATTMKVDDPAEMLSLSKLKASTKAKSATVKRRLSKKSTSVDITSTKLSDGLSLKSVIPAMPTKLSSSARRAQ